MKFIMLIAISLMSVFALAGAKERAPANSLTCLKAPTLFCRQGYVPKEVKGCWSCVAHHEKDQANPGECHKVLNFMCGIDHKAMKDENGCWHCSVKAISEPDCITAKTLTCIEGFESREDDKGCFHCIKN